MSRCLGVGSSRRTDAILLLLASSALILEPGDEMGGFLETSLEVRGDAFAQQWHPTASIVCIIMQTYYIQRL